MRVARHWTRETAKAVDAEGKRHEAAAWGWSSTSLEEAKQRARASAERIAQWLARLDKRKAPPESAEYLYLLDRPPREEIVQEFHDAAGDVSALVTRNSYGSLVLNARDLMFVDVDFRPPQPAAWRKLKAMFGMRAPPRNSEEAVFDRVQRWCGTNADLGVRLYRTAAGFRVAIIGRPMKANEDGARRILEELDSDRLYRRLCEAQECFRARLTPKPWRMRLDAPRARFPFADSATEERYRAWQRTYDETATRFATCRLVETYGSPHVHPDLAPLVELHDPLTGVGQSLQLA